MSRPRDIVTNLTIIEVTEGLHAGMRGWLRGIEAEPDEEKADQASLRARVKLVARNEPVYVTMPIHLIRPAEEQAIGMGEA